MYEQGKGTEKNYEKAVEWYRKAADQNESAAQYSLGLMYEQGTGVQRDVDEAKKWYTLAANNGDPDAKQALRQLGRTGIKAPAAPAARAQATGQAKTRAQAPKKAQKTPAQARQQKKPAAARPQQKQTKQPAAAKQPTAAK